MVRTIKMKRIFLVLGMTALSLSGWAQSSTNSPYSQYGLGALNDASTGFNRGMNGLGLAFREGGQVNYQNPASYSAVDSLTFLFDAGLSGQITNFAQNGKRLNANTAGVEYVVASFRAFKHLGVSFGLMPLTTIGYNYSSTENISPTAQVSGDTYTNTYSGSGGLHQVYLGAGWEPLKGLSFGANISYVWGTINRSVVNSYSVNTVNTLGKYYTGTINNYKADFGFQYQLKLGKKDAVIVGAVFSPGHKLGADSKCWIISKNSQTSVADTTTYVVSNGLELPTSYGAGLMWNHSNRWKIGVDYLVQKWGETQFPVYTMANDAPVYSLSDTYFQNRQKFTFGGEYCPDELSRKFVKRIRYRAGVSYATPYININGQDGPKELSASAGLAIPLKKWGDIYLLGNQSYLNVSAQWVHQEARGMIKENTFRLNVGLTFNERWFAKWKVE